MLVAVQGLSSHGLGLAGDVRLTTGGSSISDRAFRGRAGVARGGACTRGTAPAKGRMNISTAAAAVQVSRRCRPQQRARAGSGFCSSAGSNVLSAGRSLVSVPVGNFSSFASPTRSPSFVVPMSTISRQRLSFPFATRSQPWEFIPAGVGAKRPSAMPSQDGIRPCRILCYGDSNTIGFNNGGKNYNPYGDSLAEALSNGGARCEVGICGLNGHTAQDFAVELEEPKLSDPAGNTGKGLTRIIEEDGPIDLVIIMLGTNDLGKGLHPEDIANDAAQLHIACHELGVPTIALAPPFPDREKTRDLRKQVVDLLPCFLEGREGLLAYFDAEELVPRGPGSFWDPDEIHLSPVGSQLLGLRLSEWLLPVLQAANLEAGVACELDDLFPGRVAALSPRPSNRRARTMSPPSAVPATTDRRAQTASPPPQLHAPRHESVPRVRAAGELPTSITVPPASLRAQSAAPPASLRAQSASPHPAAPRSPVISKAVSGAGETKATSWAATREIATSQDAFLVLKKSAEDVLATSRQEVNRGGAPCNPGEQPRRHSAERSRSKGKGSPITAYREVVDQQQGSSPSFTVGMAVEVWSNSQQAWCPGFVKKVVANKVTTEFTLLDRAPAKKVLHVRSKEMRPLCCAVAYGGDRLVS